MTGTETGTVRGPPAGPGRKVLPTIAIQSAQVDLALTIAGWLARRGDLASALQSLEEFLAALLEGASLVPLQDIVATHHRTAPGMPVDAAVFSAFKASRAMQG